MHQVAIYDVSDAGVTRTINADSARMVFNASRTDLLLTLFDGAVREVDFQDMSNFQVVDFQQQVMRMEGVSDRLERTAESTFRTDRDMTLAMMRARIDSLRVELSQLEQGEDPAGADAAPANEGEVGAEVDASAANGEASPGMELAQAIELDGQRDMPDAVQAAVIAAAAGSPEGAAALPAIQEDANSRYSAARAEAIQGQIREFQIEIQKKYAIAVATLVFVLIGIPIALRFPRGGIGMVIGVSLAVFGVYYVGLIGGETLGDSGYVPPLVAMWATNAIFGVLGLAGFLLLGREQGTGRGGGSRELPRWLRLRRFGHSAEGAA
jgi:lipopolysaccharide export system permease protein